MPEGLEGLCVVAAMFAVFFAWAAVRWVRGGREGGQPSEAAEPSEAEQPQVPAAAAVPAPAAIPNRGELVAAISAAIAEDLGTDVSAIRIHSLRRAG